MLFKLHFAGGMRFGELAGLHVEDLGFTRSIVHIRRSTLRLIETEPKTDAGLRSVNVDPKAMAMVREFLGDRQTGRVFQSRNGTPLVHSNVNRYELKSICERIGIPMATTHAFRHGRISILRQNRVISCSSFKFTRWSPRCSFWHYGPEKLNWPQEQVFLLQKLLARSLPR